MAAVFLIATLLTGWYAGRSLAILKGRDPFTFGLGGLLIAIIVIPAGLMMSYRDGMQPNPNQRRIAFIAVAVWVVCLLGSATAMIHSAQKAEARKTINGIFEKNLVPANVAVDYIHVPILASLPVFSDPDYSGYFTIASKSGSLNEDCQVQAFNYNVRTTETNSLFKIEPDQWALVSDCN